MTTTTYSSCAADLAALVVDRIPARYRAVADAAILAARRGDTNIAFGLRAAQAGLDLGDSGDPRASAAMYACSNAAALAYVADGDRAAIVAALEDNLSKAGLGIGAA